jgi:RNase P/RNase MRP subunit p30
VHVIKLRNKNIVLLTFSLKAKFLDAGSYKKRSKIGIDNFQIKQAVTKDTALEVNFLNMIYDNFH